MTHAEKCPVCDGYGVVPREEERTCHGCKGKGWVTVGPMVGITFKEVLFLQEVWDVLSARDTIEVSDGMLADMLGKLQRIMDRCYGKE